MASEPVLRYMDFIVAPDVMAPVIAEVSRIVGRKIVVVPPTSFETSAPRKESAYESADLFRI